MSTSKTLLAIAFSAFVGLPGLANGDKGAGAPQLPSQAAQVSVVFIGEQHDNAAHHAVQAEWVLALQPAAIVFEMLTDDQAGRISAENRDDPEELARVLEWDASGWPDFEMYYPIFNAAPNAVIYGAAVPRATLGEAMQADLVDIIGAVQASRFGLDAPLPEDQLELRLDLQRVAHCDALPETLLPRMVAIQRLRDAALAQAALDALKTVGGPVAVITGNGHAREDWGAPYLLRKAAPDVSVFSLGQGEAGQMPEGMFSAVVDGPATDRGDPCDAFR